MRAVTGVNTAIVAVGLIHGALAHGSDKDWEVGLVNELMNLIHNTMSNSTSIDKKDRLLSSIDSLEHFLNDKVLLLEVIVRLRHVNGGVESGALNLGLDHIGREHDVDGPREQPARSQGMVNLLSNLGGVVELGDLARDLGAHVGKDVEVAIAEGVVQQEVVALGDGGGAADNVHDGDVLGVGAGDAIDGRELADAKGGDEGGELAHSGITIGSVC